MPENPNWFWGTTITDPNDIVTVSADGLVTGVGVGTATITTSLVNQRNIYIPRRITSTKTVQVTFPSGGTLIKDLVPPATKPTTPYIRVVGGGFSSEEIDLRSYVDIQPANATIQTLTWRVVGFSTRFEGLDIQIINGWRLIVSRVPTNSPIPAEINRIDIRVSATANDGSRVSTDIDIPVLLSQ